MRPPETVYDGLRLYKPPGLTPNGVYVGVKGRPITPAPSCRLNPAIGFEWGYCGAGPSQLALALVFDATGDSALASRCYAWIMRAFVAQLGERWQITAGEIHAWVAQWEREEAQRERMRDPAYAPTLDEALADPAGFVEGMDVVEQFITERRCHVCGCTDADCRQCIAATGRPCSWVQGEPDMCSRCAEEGGVL